MFDALYQQLENRLSSRNQLIDQWQLENSLSDEAVQRFKTAVVCSSFIEREAFKREQTVIRALMSSPQALLKAMDELTSRLSLEQTRSMPEADFLRLLRELRNEQMMLIAWVDITEQAVEFVLQSLSRLADILIEAAVQWSYHTLSERYGQPQDTNGDRQELVVIGMGKLGAHELNFSSDIDLIFCFPERGETSGTRSISNDEFFIRQSRLIVKLLEQATVDGFVYRVDTRLRPFGQSGALAISFDAMERYYQSHAREWERYAMVKARLICGAEKHKAQLEQLIKAYVYRRYLDFGVFQSIRTMKQQINAELQKTQLEHNVKLGKGGIREIEFIAQSYQLVRGGRTPALQTRGLVEVLQELARSHVIDEASVQTLIQHYYYLRRLENHLQEIDDQQTHVLPNDALNQQRLVVSQAAKDWPSLLNTVETVTSQVHDLFNRLVHFDLQETNEPTHDFTTLDETRLHDYLTQHHLQLSDEGMGYWFAFLNSFAVRHLPEKGRDYLNRLLVKMCAAFLNDSKTEKTFVALLDVLEKICNRTSYLVLLVENESVWKVFVKLACISPWVMSQIGRFPILLDELVTPDNLFTPLTKASLRKELEQSLAQIDANDDEMQMETLRLFKQVNVLRVAAADLTGAIELMVVSDYLTDIAEVLIEKVLDISWKAMADRHGVPSGDRVDQVSGFSVIGFGKLGGFELGFGSDLDIIFVHKDTDLDGQTEGETPISVSAFYSRLTRKFITLLTTRTFSGPLYEVDLRLRPNGNSGLLVTSQKAFLHYQKTKAWTWEHQALIRARQVAGDAQMKEAFEHLRYDVLSQTRDIATLKTEVVEMREKMRDALLKPHQTGFDLKHEQGGIVDIEFIVQFGVLAYAQQHRCVLSYTDNIRLLAELSAVGFVTQEEEKALVKTYQWYRETYHHQVLAEEQTTVDWTLVEPHVRVVKEVWQRLLA